jgi:hypothetical protein
MMDSSSYLAHKWGKKKGVLSLNAGHLKREDSEEKRAETKTNGRTRTMMALASRPPGAFHNSASRHHPLLASFCQGASSRSQTK